MDKIGISRRLTPQMSLAKLEQDGIKRDGWMNGKIEVEKREGEWKTRTDSMGPDRVP